MCAFGESVTSRRAFATQNFVTVQCHIELAMKICLRNDVELDCAAGRKENRSGKMTEWAIAVADSQPCDVQKRLALKCAAGSVIEEGVQELHILWRWLKCLKKF